MIPLLQNSVGGQCSKFNKFSKRFQLSCIVYPIVLKYIDQVLSSNTKKHLGLTLARSFLPNDHRHHFMFLARYHKARLTFLSPIICI